VRLSFRDQDRVREVEIAPLGAGRFRATLDGAALDLEVERLEGGRLRLTTEGGSVIAEVTAAGERRFVHVRGMDFVLEREAGGTRRARRTGGGLEAPMPGVVTRVMVAPGDAIKQGQPLVAIEAMKMEHVLRAPRDGRVRAVVARAGEMVNGGVPLVELEESD
jgi:3-methylcrotonyl-CoA carboxylase alpha subunit